jgi:hypothetical protein
MPRCNCRCFLGEPVGVRVVGYKFMYFSTCTCEYTINLQFRFVSKL